MNETNNSYDGLWKGLVICAVIVGALFYRLQNPGNLTDNFVFILGYSLLPALGVYFLLRLIFKSSGHGGLEFVTFMVLLLGISASNYVGVSNSKVIHDKPVTDSANNVKKDVANASSELSNTYKDLVASSVDAEGKPKVSDLEIDTTPVSDKDIDIITAFGKEYMRDVQNMQNTYLNKLNAIGYGSILDAERVSKPASYSESIRILLEAKSFLKENEKAFYILQDSVPERIRALGLSKANEDDFLFNFEKSKELSNARTSEFYRLENMILTETEAAIEVLENSRGRWENRNGQFTFADDADLNAYNGHVINAMNYYDRQKKLKSESDKAVIDGFKKMEN